MGDSITWPMDLETVLYLRVFVVRCS